MVTSTRKPASTVLPPGVSVFCRELTEEQRQLIPHGYRDSAADAEYGPVIWLFLDRRTTASPRLSQEFASHAAAMTAWEDGEVYWHRTEPRQRLAPLTRSERLELFAEKDFRPKRLARNWAEYNQALCTCNTPHVLEEEEEAADGFCPVCRRPLKV